MFGSTAYPTEFMEVTAQAEAFKKKLRALARASLKDFDWPADESKAQAIKDLGDHLESAIDEWIHDNCQF